jgi:hypothetical protein
MRGRHWLAVLWLAASAIPVAAAIPAATADPDADILVHVRKAGAEVVVDVDCPVRAPLPVVWDVLTDYDNMSGFISNLQYSGVRDRVDNVLTVRQKGKASHGPFSFAFDNVRSVELVPFTEIRSNLISGDLKASSFTTRIVDVGGQIHIRNSGRYTPNFWVPPLIGAAVVESETRKQYGQIRAEILRRSDRPDARAATP